MGICQHRQQVCENRTYGLHSLQLLQGDSFCWSGNHIQVSINTSIPGWKSVAVHKQARNSCKIWKIFKHFKSNRSGKKLSFNLDITTYPESSNIPDIGMPCITYVIAEDRVRSHDSTSGGSWQMMWRWKIICLYMATTQQKADTLPLLK